MARVLVIGGTQLIGRALVAQLLARGDDVVLMHQLLRATFHIDDLLVCPHEDADRCPCRKPRPGLFWRAANQHQIDLSRSFMVGDRWRDVEAGASAGCATVWIDYGYREKRPAAEPSVTVDSVRAAADWILRQL